jgi:hypothetical protein
MVGYGGMRMSKWSCAITRLYMSRAGKDEVFLSVTLRGKQYI